MAHWRLADKNPDFLDAMTRHRSSNKWGDYSHVFSARQQNSQSAAVLAGEETSCHPEFHDSDTELDATAWAHVPC